MSAPHAPERPHVELDLAALRDLAERLADLDAGAPSAVDHGGAFQRGGDPARLHRVEALSARGAARRARAAHRLVSSLPAEHRPAARWLASSAPASKAADAWPALLARALGPPALAAEADDAASRAEAARLAFRAAQAAARRGVTYEVARMLNEARAAQESAAAASAAAAADLDAWGRVRLAALLAAVEGARRAT